MNTTTKTARLNKENWNTYAAREVNFQVRRDAFVDGAGWWKRMENAGVAVRIDAIEGEILFADALKIAEGR